MSKAVSHFYRFGDFRLDPLEHLLYRQDEVVPLKPKVVETLELLLSERGRLLTKDELMERLWPDTIVEDSNLAQNIYLLRKVLGTDPGGRSYIETVPKRGYRFTAEVEEIFDNDTAGVVSGPAGARLESTSVSTGVVANSVAVLPMLNESGDTNAEYLSDGITESIINQLSQLSQLRVMARSTVFHYKGRTIAPRDVGRALGVSAVVTGRVRQLAERLIVSVELVDANAGWQLWGGHYDRSSADIFELQEAIAREISDKLQLRLTGEDREQLAKRHTDSTEAYHLFIKGRYYLNKRLIETIRKAIQYFQQAIEIDPAYALAYVGLADCYPLLNLYGELTPREAYPKAEAAARRALSIDDSLAEAHNSLGVIKLFYEWDWTGAERSFRQAIELKPGYADAHQRYGMLLVSGGRFAEASAELEQARELDPLSLITKTISGYPFYYARDFDRAALRFREVIDTDQSYSMAHFRLGLTCAQQGQTEPALAELEHSSQLSGDRDVVAALGYVYGLANKKSEAQAALAELEKREQVGFVSAYDKALIYVGLGETNAALDWLEKAFEERSYWLIYLPVDPVLDPLRASPRFTELLKKIGGPSAATPGENLTSARLMDHKSASAPVIQGSTGRHAAFASSRRWQKIATLSVLLLGLGVGIGLGIRYFNRRGKPALKTLPFQNVRFKRITDSGDIADVALSPDGKSVAYVTLRSALWIQNLATGSRLRLLAESEAEERRGLVFSPDGNQLYFYEGSKSQKIQLMRVPVLGGQTQRVLEDFNTWTAMAPDGKRFAFIRWLMERGEQTLLISDGSSERTVTTRKAPDYFGLWGKTVAWSPDGRRLACFEVLKHNNTSVVSVLIINLADGSEMRLPNQGRNWSFLYDLTWLPEGNGLLVTAREDPAAAFQIWRVSYPEGEWRKVTNDLNDYSNVSVSADSSRMVTVQASDFANLWLMPEGDFHRARQITFGNGRTDGGLGLSWTPDGKIVFASNTSGLPQIWIADADGANLKQLTYGSELSSQPVVSPDGRYIVFRSYRQNQSHIWRMDIDGENLAQLTDGPGESWPTVTPDGRDVIYTSSAAPFTTLWSVALAGGDAPKQLTDYPTSQANVSPDGKLLAAGFYDADSQSRWRLAILAASGGKPFTSFDKPLVGFARWTPDGGSIMYLDQHYPVIWKQPIRAGEGVKVFSLELPERIYNFAFSRDHKQLLMARGRPLSDALLIEDVK